jgi:DNA replication and repair protein RecF
MPLLDLKMQHFRGFEKIHFSFTKGVQHFIGENAHGKTSVLEAIYFLMTGHSFRTHHLTDLVQYSKETFLLDLHFERHGFLQHLQVQSTGKQHRVIFNSMVYTTLNQLYGLFPGVVISTEDVDMIKRGPEERRHFLDLHLYSIDPLYVYHHARFKRALKQRNYMLHTKKLSQIDFFETELAKSAAYITSRRFDAIAALEKKARLILDDFSDHKDYLDLEFKSLLPSNDLQQLEKQYICAYQTVRPKDIELQTTTIGPHREDLTFLVNQKPARLFASEGQKRTLANAIKFAQFEILQESTNDLPLLCIDDVGISLDKQRTLQLLQKLNQLEQVFITSPTQLDASYATHFNLKNFASQIH